LACGTFDGIELWDVSTEKVKMRLKGHKHQVFAVSFSPDGKTLASGSYDATVKVWDAETGKKKFTLERGVRKVNSVVFSPDSQTLAAEDSETSVLLWDVNTGKVKLVLNDKQGISRLVFAPDGLWSGCSSGEIKLWNTSTGKLVTTLKGQKSSVSSIAIASDGKLLAAAHAAGPIEIWNTSKGTLQAVLNGNQKYVSALAFSPDGKLLASGSHDKTVKLWQLFSEKEMGRLQLCLGESLALRNSEGHAEVPTTRILAKVWLTAYPIPHANH
jgi:WD40 repeat protein